jgi:hypothetical protein
VGVRCLENIGQILVHVDSARDETGA